MALTPGQLKSLSDSADRWLVASVDERALLLRGARSQGEAFERAFTAMISQLEAESGNTLLPPISADMRDAALGGLPSSGVSIDSRSSVLLGQSLTDAPPTREAGQRVGPYRLIKELGRGGMGVVWLAERADGQHARQVALKMPLVENLNWLLAARFARERNILASLEHPSIARLYDAGVDQADHHAQPYIAIEYVQGQSITDYVNAKRLKPEATAQLFIRVIEAVAHAHTQLVIHRDIKPSNILVDAKGEPHLLDFGIAKLLDDEDSPNVDATQLTRLSGRALTLDYASPEQVNNASLGTASDVYSLGVVLYELLTGGRPYRPKGPTRRDLEQAILDQDPSKPSDQLLTASTGNSESGKSARRMRGDLDTVVLKALRKDPKQRYATAQAFADDLRRYLAYEPIAAKPDAGWYRAGRFVRRNRVVLIAASFVFLALTAGMLSTLWQMRETSVQRDIALEERERSLAVRNFFEGLMGQAVGNGETFTNVQWLQRAAEVAEERYAGDPVLRATMLSAIGSIHLDRGDTTNALDLSTRAYKAALDIGDASLRTELSCQLAHVTSFRDPAVARIALEKELLQLGDSYRDAAARAVCLMIRGVVENYAGQHIESLKFIEQADAAMAKLPYRDKQRELEVLGLLATSYQFVSRFADADAAFRRLEAKNREYSITDTASGVIDYRNWALALHAGGNAIVSDEKNKTSEAIALRLNAGGSPMFVLGECRVLLARGDNDMVRQKLTALFAKFGRNLDSAQQVRSARSMLLQVALRAGELDEADSQLTEFELTMVPLDADSPIRQTVRVYRAQLLRMRGNPVGARAQLLPTLDLKSKPSSLRAGVLDTLVELSRIESALGNHEPAIAYVKRALQEQRDSQGASKPNFWVANYLVNLADAAQAGGDGSLARASLLEAVSVYEVSVGSDAPTTNAARTRSSQRIP